MYHNSIGLCNKNNTFKFFYLKTVKFQYACLGKEIAYINIKI